MNSLLGNPSLVVKEPEKTTKQHIIALCKKQEGELYTFTTEAEKGLAFVQAIRMQMSRLRQKARLRRVKLPPFKIFLHNIETKNGLDHVSIYRAQAGAKLETDSELENILNNLNSVGV